MIIQNYENALQAIYDHVGLVEDWVVCPIDDQTDMVWKIGKTTVCFADCIENLNDTEAGKYYEDDIYTQRFYPKHVYRGEIYTLVFCDPHTDGMKWWRIFSNEKEILNEC